METISEILKQTREKLNLSLKEVSEATKIRESVLNAIENGIFSYLPSIYMQSFIKEYIDFLGLDYSELKPQLDSIFKSKTINAREKNSQVLLSDHQRKVPYTSQQLNKVLYFVYAGLFLSILAIIYFSFFYEPEELKPLETLKTTDTFSLSPSSVPQTTVKQGLSQDSIKLEFLATDTVWINIVIDNRVTEKTVLYPNNRKVWKAQNFFRFTLGNAGGIIIRRNDEQLPSLSKEKVVIKNIIVTRDKFYVETSPRKTLRQIESTKPIIITPTEIKREIPILKDTKKTIIR